MLDNLGSAGHPHLSKLHSAEFLIVWANSTPPKRHTPHMVCELSRSQSGNSGSTGAEWLYLAGPSHFLCLHETGAGTTNIPVSITTISGKAGSGSIRILIHIPLWPESRHPHSAIRSSVHVPASIIRDLLPLLLLTFSCVHWLTKQWDYAESRANTDNSSPAKSRTPRMWDPLTNNSGFIVWHVCR